LRFTLASLPAFAHHSAAAKYDADHRVTVTGTVFEFAWRNPHCFLYIDVDAGEFKGRRYVVEMSSAGVLANSGWSPSRLKAGDAIQITVLPARAKGMAAGLCRDQCAIRVDHSVAR
jgi:Family of unknown function (DUF6152)